MGFFGASIESIRSFQIGLFLTHFIRVGSEAPITVVLSGSMEPGFKRGREIPIVHRVIKLHEQQETGEVDILTKGDNNSGDDRILYAHGQLWLQQHHIMSMAVGYLPYGEWGRIILAEKPLLKYLLIGARGLLAIAKHYWS